MGGKFSHIDLVEANKKGIEDMEALFEKYNISKHCYDIFECRVEDFQTEKKYDIIIAEGFLHFLPNSQEIIKKLKTLTAKNGVIVITCSDDVSLFVENMKRLIGIALAKDEIIFEEKVNYLVEIFEPQLKQLKGVSRSAKSWVLDQILNPAGVNEFELSLAQAIDYFGDNYDVLGSSPNMFTDYSWYKDIWKDYKSQYKEQFAKKRLTLLLADMPECEMNEEEVCDVERMIKKMKTYAVQYEQCPDIKYLKDILVCMDGFKAYAERINPLFCQVFLEMKAMLEEIVLGKKPSFENYSHFFSAFGRTQQYIAVMKKE